MTMDEQTFNYKWNTADLLGVGAFGHVYKVSFFLIKKYTKKLQSTYSLLLFLKKGNEIKSGKTVAVKSFEFTPDEYINREAETLKRALKNKNIVQFLALEKILNKGIQEEKVLIMKRQYNQLEDVIRQSYDNEKSSELVYFSLH